MFYNAQKGAFQKYELEMQRDWEVARWLGAIIINPHVKKNINAKDIAKFPWEIKRNHKTKEQIDKARKEAELYKKIVESK